jgi:hypothetical protein
MAASARLQVLVAENAEYRRRLEVLSGNHRSLAAELATAEAEAASIAASHAQTVARFQISET